MVLGLGIIWGGCSSLVKTKAFTSQAAKDGWTTSTSFSSPPDPVFARYTFEGPNVSVIMCSMLKEVNLLALGPPLIPIVPRILLPVTKTKSELAQEMNQFFLYVFIISKKDFFQIDFSKTQLFVNGTHDSYRPSKIKRYWQDEWDQRWDSFCFRQIEAQENTSPNQSMDTERRQVVLFFDLAAPAIQEFQLDLGNIQIQEEEIRVPPINYSLDSYYYYQAFWFTRGFSW